MIATAMRPGSPTGRMAMAHLRPPSPKSVENDCDVPQIDCVSAVSLLLSARSILKATDSAAANPASAVLPSLLSMLPFMGMPSSNPLALDPLAAPIHAHGSGEGTPPGAGPAGASGGTPKRSAQSSLDPASPEAAESMKKQRGRFALATRMQ